MFLSTRNEKNCTVQGLSKLTKVASCNFVSTIELFCKKQIPVSRHQHYCQERFDIHRKFYVFVNHETRRTAVNCKLLFCFKQQKSLQKADSQFLQGTSHIITIQTRKSWQSKTWFLVFVNHDKKNCTVHCLKNLHRLQFVIFF